MTPAAPTAWWQGQALGGAVVVGTTSAGTLAGAVAEVTAEIAVCDAAASRFRADSDLSRVNRHAGRTVAIGPWLVDAVATALQVAADTDGLVDPTIGATLLAIGYDRDFFQLDPGRPVQLSARPTPGWRRVDLDTCAGTLRVPAGVHLDLGATAKALCADRAARRSLDAVGGGVLVSLGGDLALAGDAPAGGWPVRVTDRADTPPDDPTVPGQTVALVEGGLATSGTAARRWHRSGHDLHHLIDPRTGLPAAGGWRTATIAAPTCLAANVASTAAIILGDAAPAWLEARRCGSSPIVAGRLVADDGLVTRIGPWPVDPDDPAPAPSMAVAS